MVPEIISVSGIVDGTQVYYTGPAITFGQMKALHADAIVWCVVLIGPMILGAMSLIREDDGSWLAAIPEYEIYLGIHQGPDVKDEDPCILVSEGVGYVLIPRVLN